jgi:CBS domain-containing protein
MSDMVEDFSPINPANSGSFPFFRPVSELIKGPIQSISPEATASDCSKKMSDASIGSLVVIDQQGMIGMLTSTDLVEKVLAEKKSTESQVAEIMSSPVICINKSETIFEALMLMIHKGISHLVITENDMPIGVISEWDWMTAQQRHPASLIHSIKSANSAESLAKIRKETLPLIEQLFMEEGQADSLTRLITEIHDQITCRLIELALEEMDMEGRGGPPSPFSWMGMGSEGRREQTISTDQDNALIFEAPSDEELARKRSWFLDFAEKVVSGLEICGFPRCPGNTMAINPKLCLTEEEWLILFGQILTTPTPQALLKAGIYFDFRSLFGKHELVRKLRKRLIEHSPRSRLFLKLMSENDLDAGRPPVHQLDWKIRRLLGFGNLSVDLKQQALRPLVMGIRTLALSAGIEESHSLERIRELEKRGELPGELSQALQSAYDFIMLLKIRWNFKTSEKENVSGNRIQMKQLNPLEQRFLEESLKVILRLQDEVYARFGGIP